MTLFTQRETRILIKRVTLSAGTISVGSTLLP